jgi:hypothetical protein
MQAIRATPRYRDAIHAVAEILARQRIDAMFVGSVARSAWLGIEVAGGAIDVLALMNGPQKNQVAMMASHRGFRVDRDEIEQSVELDLVPLNFVTAEGDIRVHVLLATNALYGRMFANRKSTTLDDRELHVASAEDLALMLLVAEDRTAVETLTAMPEFDRRSFHETLASIGIAS